MGQAYNESYVEFGSKRRVNFCNKVFTAWDFNITDPNTAKLKRVHIRTDFEVPAVVVYQGGTLLSYCPPCMGSSYRTHAVSRTPGLLLVECIAFPCMCFLLQW